MSQIESLTSVSAQPSSIQLSSELSSSKLSGSTVGTGQDVAVGAGIKSDTSPKLSFKAALEKVADKLGINSKADLHSELVGLQKQALTRSSFSNKELLLYQVKAQQMHMQAEMVSKVGESMLGTMRKLQQGQGG